MKSTTYLFLITALLLAFHNQAFARVELFEVASEELRKTAEAENGEYLVQTLYPTKNHQFLILNPNALHEDEIEISFFEDEFEFEVIEREIRTKYGDNIDLRLESTNLTNKLYKALGVAKDKTDQSQNLIIDYGSKVSITSSVVQEFQDENGAPLFRYKQRTFNEDIDLSIGANHNPREFRILSLNFHDIESNKKYYIRHLPNTPEVHLLYEIDEQKILGRHHEPNSPREHAKYNAELRKYHAYLRRNGFAYLAEEPDQDEIRKMFYEMNRDSLFAEKRAERREFMYDTLLKSGFNKDDIEKIKEEVEAHYEKQKRQRKNIKAQGQGE